jgi:hypothetical protein
VLNGVRKLLAPSRRHFAFWTSLSLGENIFHLLKHVKPGKICSLDKKNRRITRFNLSFELFYLLGKARNLARWS